MNELHLHLDGSLTPSVVKKIAEEEHIELSSEDALCQETKGKCERTAENMLPSDEALLSQMSFSSEKGTLADYLKCFELPIRVLQTPQAVRFAAMKLSEELAREGISYAEIRFAPQFHTQKGYTQEQILLGAIEALGYASLLGIEISFILCMMRGQSDKANEETLNLAVKYFGRGVCALDLAGDEALWPVGAYEGFFSYAAKNGLPFTVHAGEAAGAESVEEALRLGAWRIGHGIAAINDRELMKYLAEHHIPLEMCPTSNLQTGAAQSIEAYPLVEFLERGMCVTVNTDNRTVSDTTLNKEFELIKRINGYSENNKRQLIEHAEMASFKNLAKAR